MPPAARITDMHVCPMVTPGLPPVPHVGGPVIAGEPTVITAFMPQARISDQCTCVGPPDVIVKGSPTVLVGGMPAARMGDMTAHGGVITTGAPNVIIGEAGAGGMSPAVLDNFHTQEQSNSCVIATTRNMIHYHTGIDVPEDQLREEMREIMGDPDHDFETQGTNPIHAQELLRNHGVVNTVHRNQSADDLSTMTADGDPVMIGFSNPGHRVALSGVETDADDNRTFVVMDPAGQYNGRPRRMSEAQFNQRYNSSAIVIEPD